MENIDYSARMNVLMTGGGLFVQVVLITFRTETN